MSNREFSPHTQSEEIALLHVRIRELEEQGQQERTAFTALMSTISVALIQKGPLKDSLHRCTQALVTHLDAAFARIWLLNAETQTLELVASAGLYVHLDGPHSRIPVGSWKIGRIAAEQQPHLTNAVVGDPQVSDQEWAKREKMVAFAGYPLVLDGVVLGVMALFSQHTLSSPILEVMASASRSIALGIEHKHQEEERARLLLLAQGVAVQTEAENMRLAAILDKLPDGFMIFDDQWRYQYINPQAVPYAGKPWQELLGQNVWEMFPALRGSLYDQHYHHAMRQQEPVAFEIFNATLARWFDIHAYPIPGGLAVYFHNITERKQVEAERVSLLASAENARSEAETTLQVRNDFLSSISHDLKTPLAVMQGNVQLVQRRINMETPLDRPWTRERLDVIAASIRKMNGMVEDLLDIARLQTGQELDLQMHSLSLNTLVQRICKEQQETSRRHVLRVEAGKKDFLIHADALRVDRALTNVLGNAIKYSPQGGHIIVSLREEREGTQAWITLTIQDEGLGIPEKELPFIFDPFYRANNTKGRLPGTGVGLASVAQVMQEHQGSISVTSIEGQGSCFIIRFPAPGRSV